MKKQTLSNSPWLVVLIGCSLFTLNCGNDYGYEVYWAIDGSEDCALTSGSAQGSEEWWSRCGVTDAISCSQVGIDAVEVHTVQAATDSTVLFPCYDPEAGSVGRGPKLEEGKVVFEVRALSPGGDSVTGSPILEERSVGKDEVPKIFIYFPRPDSCNDGVDNDNDGLVDSFDPGCDGTADQREAAQ